MKISITSLCNAALLGALALGPFTTMTSVMRADEHSTYHDKARNDDHEWNEHEERAYRIWLRENHRKARDFDKLSEEDRQAYWAWRHDHSDAVLKLDIR